MIARLPSRGEAAIWASGFFSLGLVLLASVLMPVWAVRQGFQPAELGLALALQSLLPALLSVHGGALVDRFGARRVLLVLSAAGGATAPLFPWATTVAPFAALVVAFGLCQALAWVAAQSAATVHLARDPGSLGRFSFLASIGTFVAPAAGGLAWEFGGGAAGFGLLTLWWWALAASALLLPGAAASPTPPDGRRWIAEILPRPDSYREALRLMRNPATLFVLGMTVARMGTVAMQLTFYPVLLEAAGVAVSTIGWLIAVAAFVGGPSALLSGMVARRIGARRLLMLTVGLAVVAISVTPLLAGVPQLLAASLVFGIATGLSMTMVLAMLAESVPLDRQGVSVGLRSTANRIAHLAVPILMGVIADAWGIAASFFVTGGLLAFVALGAWLLVRAAGDSAR